MASQSVSPGQDTPPSPGAGIPASLRFRPGPLRAYLPTQEEKATIEYAEHLLRSACMEARGYRYDVPKYVDVLSDLTLVSLDLDSRLFGIVDAAEAKMYGYGQAPRNYSSSIEVGSREAEVALWGEGEGDALSADSKLEWKGDLTPSNTTAGCHVVAADQLAGLDHMDVFLNPLAEELERESVHRAQARPQYTEIQQEWATCMANKGYEIEDPAAPAQSRAFKAAIEESGEHPMDRTPGSRASSAEIALAGADVDCKVDVNLVIRLSRLIHREQESLIDENVLQLDEERDQLTAIIEEATRVMSG